MKQPDINEPVYRGRLTGVFRSANKRPIGNYVMAAIDWRYFRIDECKPAGDVDIAALKTGDFWYADVLRNLRRWRFHWPWQKKAEIFIPFGEGKYYEGDLYRVLVRNLKIDPGKTSFLAKEWDEAKGDVFFQLEPRPKPVTKTDTESFQSKKSDVNVTIGTNVIADPIIKPFPETEYLKKEPPLSEKADQQQIRQPVVRQISSSSIDGDVGTWAKWFGRLIAILIAAAIGYFLWKSFPVLGAIFIALVILWIIGAVFSFFPIFRWIISLAILFFVGQFLFRMMERNGMATEQLKTRDGNVRVGPPRKIRTRQPNGNSDFTTEKDITWYDFSENAYRALYKTSQNGFDQSEIGKNKLREQLRANSSTTLEFASGFYNDLYRMDRQKIRRVAKIFSDSATRMHLSPLQTAEMVVTFIQEIPYCLVHEGSCEKAVGSGVPFVVEYHNEKKPCLPNVTEGIQTPYEFLHNLKGDCDTRTLLGFAILSQLNIGSSLWVSEVYSHSILGIAVPAGHGVYKEVEGIRHYGVELTAKGYRIGMVSPEHARPRNWNVTAYNNPK